jgi:hypothetical protein
MGNVKGKNGRYRSVYLHRVLTGYKRVGFRDGNSLNLTRENLFKDTKARNCHRQGPCRTNTLPYKGVTETTTVQKRFVAQLQNGKVKKQAYCYTLEEAAHTYDK